MPPMRSSGDEADAGVSSPDSQLDQLRIAARAASTLGGQTSDAEIFERIAGYTQRLLMSDGACVMLVGEAMLWVVGSSGFTVPPVLPRTANAALAPLYRGETVLLEDIVADPRFAYTHRAFPEVCSLAFAPVAAVDGQTIAFIAAGWKTRQPLGESQRNDLAQLALWLLQELGALHHRHVADDVEADLDAIMNAVSDPVWMVDEASRLTAFNSATARLSEGLVGRTPSLGVVTGGPLPPALRERWVQAIADAFRGWVTRFGLEWPLNGRTLPFEVVYHPVFRGGRVVRALGLLRDLSASRDLTEHARSRERLFRAVAENSLDTISIVHRDGTVRWISPAVERTLGLAGAALVGKPFVDLIHVDEREAFLMRITALLAEAGSTDRRVVRMRHVDGTLHVFELRSVSLIDDPVVNGVLVVSRDVTEAQRARYVENVIVAQENERRRIARELHDSTGQTLTSLLVGLTTLEKRLPEAAQEQVAALRKMTSRAVEDVGRLAKGLHPSILDDHGLAAALERLSEMFASSELRVDVQLVGFPAGARLPSALETTLYRVAQECLTNVVKHARATTTSVTMEWRVGEVRLVVEDDGCGVDVGAALRERPGLGLRGIHERVALVGGQVEIESTPGKGTAVFARVPVPSAS